MSYWIEKERNEELFFRFDGGDVRAIFTENAFARELCLGTVCRDCSRGHLFRGFSWFTEEDSSLGVDPGDMSIFDVSVEKGHEGTLGLIEKGLQDA